MCASWEGSTDCAKWSIGEALFSASFPSRGGWLICSTRKGIKGPGFRWKHVGFPIQGNWPIGSRA